MLDTYQDPKFAVKRFAKELIIYLGSLLRIRPNTRALVKQWSGLKITKKNNAIIIAGGPSYNNELAEYIKKNRRFFDVFAINFYCLNKRAEEIIPDFYVLSDPAHIETKDASIKEKNRNLLAYLIAHPLITLCTPIDMWKKEFFKNKNASINFDDAEVLFSKNIDPVFPRGYTSNTAFKAIAIAVKLGYKNIYILGLDYDYPRMMILNKDNRLFMNESHHYDSNLVDYSHIFKNVSHALHWWSFDYLTLMKLKKDNLFNVTNTSLVDAFTRMSVENFLGLKHDS